MNNNISSKNYAKYKLEPQAFIVINRNDNVVVYGCESIGEQHELSLSKENEWYCTCNRVYLTTEVPKTVQDKFMNTINDQVIKDYESKKENYKSQLEEYKKSVEMYRKEMTSTYEMLKEYLEWAKKVENVNPDLFNAWIDMKHFMNDKGINFND